MSIVAASGSSHLLLGSAVEVRVLGVLLGGDAHRLQTGIHVGVGDLCDYSLKLELERIRMEHKDESYVIRNFRPHVLFVLFIELTNLALTLAHADHGQRVVALVSVANAEEEGDPATGAENG